MSENPMRPCVCVCELYYHLSESEEQETWCLCFHTTFVLRQQLVKLFEGKLAYFSDQT